MSIRAALTSLKRQAARLDVSPEIIASPYAAEIHRRTRMAAASRRAEGLSDEQLRGLTESGGVDAFGAIYELAQRGDEPCRRRIESFLEHEILAWGGDLISLLNQQRLDALRKRWWPNKRTTKSKKRSRRKSGKRANSD